MLTIKNCCQQCCRNHAWGDGKDKKSNVLCVVQAKELLVACRDAGVNFFDNAEVYAKGHAEEIMGKAFKVAAAYIRMIDHML